MAQHHGCTEDHCRRVCSVGAHNVRGNVPASWFKKCIFLFTCHEQFGVPEEKFKRTRPTLQPGTIPGPPTRAAPMLETIAPYKLGITMTSNWPGRATSCIELKMALRNRKIWVQWSYVLSTIMSLNSMPDDLYSSATRRKVLRKRPSPSFMMLALWTHVTFLRLFFNAKSKANRLIRSAFARVETLRLSTTPG